MSVGARPVAVMSDPWLDCQSSFVASVTPYRDAIVQNLEGRFGAVEEPMRSSLETIQDEARLRSLLRQTLASESLAAFRETLSEDLVEPINRVRR